MLIPSPTIFDKKCRLSFRQQYSGFHKNIQPLDRPQVCDNTDTQHLIRVGWPIWWNALEAFEIDAVFADVDNSGGIRPLVAQQAIAGGVAIRQCARRQAG